MKRILAIGLDGCNWQMASLLPKLTELKKRSTYGILRSTIPPVTGPAWVSYATGCNPGKHGIYSFIRIDRQEHTSRLNSSKDVNGLTLHEIFSIYGKRCIILSLPLSYPPKGKFSGIMISDFLYHDKDCVPSSKKGLLDDYEVLHDTSKKGDDLVTELVRSEKMRFRTAKKLLEQEDWDLFYIWVSGIDAISHEMYGNIVSPDGAPNMVLPLLKVIDDGVDELRNAVDDDTVIVINSDHGFQTCHRKVYVNVLLEKMGQLKLTLKEDKSIKSHVESKQVDDREPIRVPKIMHQLSRVPILKAVGEKLFSSVNRRFRPSTTLDVDHEKSKLFMPTGESWGLFMIDGAAGQQEEAHKKLESSMKKFGVHDAFKLISPSKDIYFGKALDRAPDIILIPEDDVYLSAEIKESRMITSEQTEFHHPNGLFLVHGPGIRHDHETGPHSIIDLAPSILHMVGLPIPSNMDGKVIDDLFLPSSEYLEREEKRMSEDKIAKMGEKGRLGDRIKALKRSKKI